jgi:hypothetical protein
VGTLTRIELTRDGVGSLAEVQRSCRLQPLSDFLGTPAPPPAPPVQWPAWDEEAFTRSPRFFELVDFLLRFSPVLEEDRDARELLAAIGVDGTGEFSVASLDEAAAAQLQQGMDEGRERLAEAASRFSTSVGLFGNRAEMSGKYVERGLGAMKGIYGLPLADAWYGGWQVDSEGHPPVGRRGYTVTFGADELPRVRFFWSATMYRLPERLLVANPIDRYSIGDRTPGVRYAADGSLTLTISHAEPADPEARANWLPAPEGPFLVAVRGYGGDDAMRQGTFRLPPLVPIRQ